MQPGLILSQPSVLCCHVTLHLRGENYHLPVMALFVPVNAFRAADESAAPVQSMPDIPQVDDEFRLSAKANSVSSNLPSGRWSSSYVPVPLESVWPLNLRMVPFQDAA